MKSSRPPADLVVTGASGFIGGALVRHLRAQGHPVRGFSRRAGEGWQQVERYNELRGGVLVHLAETANIAAAEREGEAAAEARVQLLQTLVTRFDRVVYVSSGAVYGDAVTAPRRPDERVDPRGAYTRAKLRCEAIALEHGGAVCRLGNVYGAHMSAGTVVPDVIAAARREGPLELRDAAPVRDFVHVDDCVLGLMGFALERVSGVFNLGSGVGTSTGELARLVLSIRGERQRSVVETSPTGRSSTLVLDISSTTAATGFVPTITLRQGLTPLVFSQEFP